jgi:hypothetical protein
MVPTCGQAKLHLDPLAGGFHESKGGIATADLVKLRSLNYSETRVRGRLTHGNRGIIKDCASLAWLLGH